MPNQTMFLKYSRKRETRGQSCQGFVLHSERKGNLFLSPHQPCRPSGNRTGYVTAFLLTILRDSNAPSSLSGAVVKSVPTIMARCGSPLQ